MSTGGLPPAPIYGDGVYVYSAYFAVALVGLLISGWQDLRNTSGGERAEITFILIGGIRPSRLPLFLRSFWII